MGSIVRGVCRRVIASCRLLLMTRNEVVALRSQRSCVPSLVLSKVGADVREGASGSSSSAAGWLLAVGGIGVVILAMQSDAVLSFVTLGALGFLGYSFIKFAMSETSKAGE